MTEIKTFFLFCRKALENNHAVLLGEQIGGLLVADDPVEGLHAPELFAEAGRESVLVLQPIGDEIGHGEEVEAQVRQKEGLNFVHAGGGVLDEILGELAADDAGVVLFQPAQDAGIEGFDHVIQFRILLEQIHDLAGELHVVVIIGFDLDQQRCLAVEQGQDLLQIGDLLPRTLQGKLAQNLGRDRGDIGVDAGGSLEVLIVHDDKSAVAAEMDVQLRAVAVVGRQTEGAQRVLRDPGGESVQAPVGIVIVAQPAEAVFGSALAHHAQSIEAGKHQTDQIQDQDEFQKFSFQLLRELF